MGQLLARRPRQHGEVLAFVADRFDMTGDAGGAQVYVAPRR